VALRLLGRRLVAAIRGPSGPQHAAPPISRETGVFAYLTARSIDARRIVEFGTGTGVSTIYLAAAVKDNGGGLVIGSEIREATAAKAEAHLAEAGLADYVDVRRGDGQLTLADVGGTADMALLDGAKDLYITILKMLRRHLRPRAVVLADNIGTHGEVLEPYVAYVRDPRSGFRSVMLPYRKGIEFSVRLEAPEVDEEGT
jgi:predicted O-methyltransferase YrrM